jgi:hypothetical protein
MDTKETNNLLQEAALEETLTDAANLSAENQPEKNIKTPENAKTKAKRVSKPKKAVELPKTDEETLLKPEIIATETESEVENKPETAIEDEPEIITDTEKESKKIEESIQIDSVPDPDHVETDMSIHSLSSKKEIIDFLKSLIENSNSDLKDKVDLLKQSFYKIQKQEVDNARKAFLEAGNAIETFVADEDTLETDFKALLNDWREKRAKRLSEQEKQRKANLEKKKQIIENIKGLTDSTEDISRNFPEFRKLQQSWKETGPVPQDQVNELWKNYQLEVERFYDLLKINNEFREYDFKKNLEIKTILCDSAEKLAKEADVVIAFRQLQKLHEDWRETGPVAKEFREEIWNRFKTASSIINKNHQGFFERLKAAESENLAKKSAICETLEAIDLSQLKTYKDWDAKTAEIIHLQGQWKAIGFAPKKVNIKVFERFRSVCDNFFRQKSEFYKASKDVLNQNLEKKKNLCEKAESLKDSTDWKVTSDLLIQTQKEWKSIGPVPKKFSDSIWKRFIAACDYFFEQKEKNAPSQKNEEQHNLSAKKELISQIEAITPDLPEEEAIKLIRELTAKWNEIGHVPFKEKDKIYKSWHEAMDKQMERLHMDKNNRRLNNFQHNLEDMNGKSQGKVLYERERLLRQFDALSSEIKTSENNIGFFTTSNSSGNGLLDVMKKKIEELKVERDLIYKKIKMIDDQL